MNNYSFETQQEIPVFIPSNPPTSSTEMEDDMYHLVFCEIYVYDYFQNKRCLFKGLGKILVTPNNVNIETEDSSPSDPLTAKQTNTTVALVNKTTCVQQVQSIYSNQLKKRFSKTDNQNMYSESNTFDVTYNDLGENSNLQCSGIVQNNLSDNFSEININECALNSDSDCSNDWSNPISLSNEEIDRQFNTNSQDVFDRYIEVEDFTESENLTTVEFIDPTKDLPIDSLQTMLPENMEVTNKLDYEMLLPHSVVESSSYLSLQSQSPQDVSDYANMYKGLFDQVDDIQNITGEEIERKTEFEEYFDSQTDDFNDDQSYLITDISNSTQNTKKDSFSSSKQSEVNCEICNRKCRSINALNHHMLVHSEDRPFVCEICKKAFKEQPTLRRHMWTHMDKQHQCDICEKYFVEKSSLRRHISTIHADFKPGSRPAPTNAKQQFNCMKCGKVFKSHTKYSMHQELHGNPNFECDTCGKVYAGRSHLKIHQRIHTGEKPYVCNICNMKFAFKHVLKSHQARIHQKVHKFKCNLCSLSFIKKSDLSSHASCHMLNMKKNKRHYVSRKNSKKYSSLMKKSYGVKNNKKFNFGVPTGPVNGLFGQLIDVVPDKVKIANDDDIIEDIDSIDKSDSVDSKDGLCKSPKSLIDQGKKNKECLECFKAFERMGDLKRHIISHIVENITKKARDENHTVPIYECEICYNAVFKQVDKFKKHLREHAKLTLYQCDICDRAFGDSSNFSKHKKVHGVSYLKCTICNRKFNTKRMMIMHMEYHRHNKPKSCNYCKKLFHFDSTLRKHVKIAHLAKGKMTYRCEECGERFNSVKLKWEHQWEVHGMRKVDADCHMCSAQFRKVSLLRAHLIKEHTVLMPSKSNMQL